MLWHIRAPNLHDFRIANTLLQSQNRLFLRLEVSERVVLRDVRLRVPSHALCLECTHRSTVLCDRLASERVEAQALFVDAQSDRGRPQEMLVQVAVVAAHTSLLPSTDMRRGFENELFLVSWTGKQRRKVIDENTHRYVADGPPAFHHVNVAAGTSAAGP